MANTNNDLDDLICNEVDFSFQDKQDEERAKRYAAETKIYFIIKDFLDILNQNAILHEFKLKKIALGFQKTKKQFIMIFYIVNKWQHYFVDGLAKCLEEKLEAGTKYGY